MVPKNRRNSVYGPKEQKKFCLWSQRTEEILFMVPKNRRNSVYGPKEIELNHVKIFIEYQTVNKINFLK